MKERIRQITFGILLVLFLLAGMLVCSTATSPLYPHNFSYDSAFFRFIGHEIVRGKTPYTDVWDHKGPVLFFIQALGASGDITNKGKNILFLLQTVSVILSAFFMYKAYRAAVRDRANTLKFTAYLVCVSAVFSLTIEGGNLSEEWCLPMACCSFWLMTSYAVNAADDPLHPQRYAFFHGINFALMALIRINNALPVCAGLAMIGLYLIYKKQWRNLFSNIIFGILGIAAVVIPVFLWFYFRGALGEMLYAAFGFNLNYAQIRSYYPYTGTEFIIRYLPVISAILIFILHRIHKRRISLMDLINMAALAVSIWMLTESNAYLHYFTVFLPVLFLVFIHYADRLHGFTLLILLTLCGWFAWQNIQRIPDLISLHRQSPMFTAAAQIPEEERSSVIAVNMPPEIYLNYGLEPVSRFCNNQHVHFSIDPALKEEFLTTLNEKQPLWILAFCDGETKIPEVQELIDRSYQHRFDQSDICYYRLKDQ